MVGQRVFGRVRGFLCVTDSWGSFGGSRLSQQEPWKAFELEIHGE